jgi:hypothetical protein
VPGSTVTSQPTTPLQKDQEVEFDDGRGNPLTGVITRVWTKAPYVTIRTLGEDRSRNFVRIIREVKPAPTA